MKQIRAIFEKDVRHLWPEILASLAVVAALVLVYPREWRSQEIMNTAARIGLFARYGGDADVVAALLVLLVPVSWFILIARMVHSERLVGNTQFWLTRPYEWPKFLAAKLLFLACFVYAPFAVAQCALLAEGGFHPLSYLTGLFFSLLYVTFILILPILALSVVTPSFGKLTLVVLGVLLFIAGDAVGYSALPYDLKFSGASHLADLLSAVFLICGCAAALLVQYARRRTHVAWLLVGATALLMSVLAFVDPDRWLMDRYYPVQSSGSDAPLQLAQSLRPYAAPAEEKEGVAIVIPVHLSGVAADGVVVPGAVRASIQAPGGAHWQSQWQSDSGGGLLPGASEAFVVFRMPRAVYDRFKETPVVLNLAVAINDGKVTATSQQPLPVGEFSVPDVGICKAWHSDLFGFTGSFSCRSAMRQPPLTLVSGPWTEGECSAQATDEGTVSVSGWAGTLDNSRADFGITSVWQFAASLPRPPESFQNGQPRHPWHLCAGSMLTFTSYRQISSEQLNLTLADFHLPGLPRFGVGALVSQP
jgi:hypothetical protein